MSKARVSTSLPVIAQFSRSNGVITKAQVLNVVDTVVELTHGAAESDRPLGSARRRTERRSGTVIIEAIRKSFLVKGAP
jgi:hypothetical protein